MDFSRWNVCAFQDPLALSISPITAWRFYGQYTEGDPEAKEIGEKESGVGPHTKTGVMILMKKPRNYWGPEKL